MGSILGRQEYLGWQKRLAEQIRYSSAKLQSFRQKDLADPKLQLINFDSDIKKLYGSFKDILGRIAATKALHLICPDFFPMWDNDIARAVRIERNRRFRATNHIEEFSEEDYFRFMEEIHHLIRTHLKTLSGLSNRYGRSKLRILDECLWWAVHRPLALFL